MTATDELQALLDNATAGEWFVRDDVTPWANWICAEGGDADICEIGEGWTPRDMPEAEANAAAIVAAVNWCRADRPALIAEVERLREAVKAVIEATRAYFPPDGITAMDCINRVLEATDNPEICALDLWNARAALAGQP